MTIAEPGWGRQCRPFGIPFPFCPRVSNNTVRDIGVITGQACVGLDDGGAIYLDEYTSNVQVTNNTVANCLGMGMQLPMIDVTRKKYASSITLLPFTSAVLMVDPNP